MAVKPKYSTKKGTKQRLQSPYVSVKAHLSNGRHVKAYTRKNATARIQRVSGLAEVNLGKSKYFTRMNQGAKGSAFSQALR